MLDAMLRLSFDLLEHLVVLLLDTASHFLAMVMGHIVVIVFIEAINVIQASANVVFAIYLATVVRCVPISLIVMRNGASIVMVQHVLFLSKIWFK